MAEKLLNPIFGHTREEQLLFKKPTLAWPTLLIFAFACLLVIVSTTLFYLAEITVAAASTINVVALYLFFTPTHDASHRAVSHHESINTLVGSIALFFWAPLGPFPAYRWLHLQHHRFTNEAGDPDLFAGTGKYSLPVRWLFMDLYQIIFFIRYSGQVRKNLPYFAFNWSCTLGLCLLAYANDMFQDIVLLWFLPTRIVLFALTFLLDFLPHYPHKTAQSENAYLATSIRYGYEWLLTPIFIFHNYHLVHHLYPTLPFYRLIKVWLAREQYHLSKSPMLVSAFRLVATNIAATSK
jgi:beta-carotene hydroxylase